MKIYLLPFTAGAKVTTDADGARSVARLCCELAKANHSHLEIEAEYAWQMAAFIAGHMAAQDERSERKLFLFSEFLQLVEDWLELAYPLGPDPGITYDPKMFEDETIKPAHLRSRI